MQVPFLDLKAQYESIKDEIDEAIQQVLDSCAFAGGPFVEKFEKEFAEFCETEYCVGVNSGTDALRFALIAANIGPGHEVITVPNTFIATTEAISQAGATPVFVDIDERTYNMDSQKLEDYLKKRLTNGGSRKGPRPKAVLPVHLYGQPADMNAILEIADRYDLVVIEDACQAHGAEYFSKRQDRWRRVGSMGLAAAFSFYPGKNLGACGEAGAVTTNDEEIAQKVRMLRNHGQTKKYFHEMEGYNGRLDAIQAAILRIKLKHLNEWNERRCQHACRYNELLAQVDGIIGPYEPKWAKPVYHLYVIRTNKRDDLQKHLSEHEIATGLHYPIPLHLQKAYVKMGYKQGDFPRSERIAPKTLSLPIYPGLSDFQQDQIVDTIREFISL